MNSEVTPPESPSGSAPGRRVTLALVALALLLLGGLLTVVLLDGASFNSFPGRIIGVSLLSDVDPHYRIGLFLLFSALAIVASFATFTIAAGRPGWTQDIPLSGPTTVLLGCLVANGLAAALHPDHSLFLTATAHCAFMLAIWLWHSRNAGAPATESFLLSFTFAWQAATLVLWLSGLQPGLAYYPLTAGIYLLARRVPEPGSAGRLSAILQTCVISAPVLLIAAVEWAYFQQGESVAATDTLLRFAALLLLPLAAAGLLNPGRGRLAWLGCISLLMTTFIINQYDNTVLYKGYDLFHLPEKMLPLHQWDQFLSIPFIDYHPGHGIFDMLPHGAYYLFNGGNPLESLAWGNGYFMGWTVQTLYIALLFAFLAPHLGTMTAFGLLWLLPVFHLLEPYNTLLLLPMFNLLPLSRAARPGRWWLLQWLITLALVFWRADFGMIAAVGNLICATALCWYRGSWRHLLSCATTLLAISVPLVILVLASDPALVTDRLIRWRDLMEIQLLAASYDHFFKEWNNMAWGQYVIMPALGALAGGYSLARLYLRRDLQHLGLHLAIIFGTAIGFALSIRLFQRHSLVEGVIKSNFFLLMPLLVLMTLDLSRRWKSTLALALVVVTFIAIPKTESYREKSPWSPRRSYPVSTHPGEFPLLAKNEPRLDDRVRKFDSFVDFSKHYLRHGEAFYDFSNAPMLYMLADIRLPVYVYETVWHTSEKVQDTTLAELENLRQDNRLPFVVFRQNKERWDALDGVDNALRSYKVAEYIYQHYRPCVHVVRFDIWTDKRRSCENSLARRLPEGSPAASDARPLERNYLDQYIGFGHLAYIWANFDEHEEPIAATYPLDFSTRAPGAFTMRAPGDGSCRQRGCYLEFTLESPVAGEAMIRLGGQKLASFAVRGGSHRYRLRISALWRWHQQVGGHQLRLKLPADATLQQARLLELPR